MLCNSIIFNHLSSVPFYLLEKGRLFINMPELVKELRGRMRSYAFFVRGFGCVFFVLWRNAEMSIVVKRGIAVFLCLILFLGTVVIGGEGFAELLEIITVKASANSLPSDVTIKLLSDNFAVGATIEFELTGKNITHGYWTVKSESYTEIYDYDIYGEPLYRDYEEIINGGERAYEESRSFSFQPQYPVKYTINYQAYNDNGTIKSNEIIISIVDEYYTLMINWPAGYFPVSQFDITQLYGYFAEPVSPGASITIPNDTIPMLDYIPSNYNPLEYSFLGWSLSNGATYPDYYPGDKIRVNSNIELYPVFARCSLNYTLFNDGTAEINGSQVSGYYGIPSTIENHSVTSIGVNAFFGCESLTNINIPESVTNIGFLAFLSCRGLKSITIPKSVISIELDFDDYPINPFSCCPGLSSIIVDPANPVYHSAENCLIETESKTLISGCKTSVIPDDGSVTNIGSRAFDECTGLTSITIPESVTSIADDSFDSCTGLTSIIVNPANTVYHSRGNCIIETASKTLIRGCKNSVIPDDESVEIIGRWAFSGCSGLTSITIPFGIKAISIGAFARCSGLTSICIPNSVTSIGTVAFGACDALTTITIPESVTSITENPFSSIRLTSIIVAQANPVYHSAGNCLIETASKTLISGCKTSVIPDDGSVTSIGYAAFDCCTGLTSITIPESVTIIGEFAFEGCSGLTSITIPESVTSIEKSTFDCCYNLTRITIPASIKSIGYRAFKYCDALEKVNYMCSPRKWNKINIAEGNEDLINANISFNSYNRGEETYSFENYGDSNSPHGHCFGMSITSAGYYSGNLKTSAIGIDSPQKLYNVSDGEAVRKNICYYQHVQGNYSEQAMVAGSIPYLHSGMTAEQCWNETVNYVKSNNNDNEGDLQIQIWINEKDGHAVNFLYYNDVNGQNRIYAYDNNFPDTEVYFYFGNDGKIHETPKSTFSESKTIQTICLIDMEKYFEAAKGYNTYRYVYANAGEIEINGSIEYPMACGEDGGMTMYEIPENATKVNVIPLVDNASFEYANKKYSFTETDDNTYGILTLGVSADDSSKISFNIKNVSEQGKPDTFTLTYDANGGKGAPAPQTGGEKITLSNVKPTREGYKFLGWGLSGTASDLWQPGDVFFFILKRDTTIYAVWEKDDSSANPTAKAKLYTGNSTTITVWSNVTVVAKADNVPKDYKLVVCDKNNKVLKEGDNKSVSYNAGAISSDTVFNIHVVDGKGNIMSSDAGELSKTIEVKTSGGFFAWLFGFLFNLFGITSGGEVIEP